MCSGRNPDLLYAPSFYDLFDEAFQEQYGRLPMINLLTNIFLIHVLRHVVNNNIIQPLGEYLSYIQVSWRNAAFITYNYHNVILSLSFTISLYILIERKSKYKVALVPLFVRAKCTH